MDVALGVLTAGALLYAYRRDISGMVSASTESGSGERKRKRDEIETLETLGPIMSDPAYLDVTERILLQCDPQTIIRVASVCHTSYPITSLPWTYDSGADGACRHQDT